MINYNTKFSIRMNENLKTRVKLLALKNNISFTKMLNLLLELGYQSYMKKFENNNEDEVKFYE